MPPHARPLAVPAYLEGRAVDGRASRLGILPPLGVSTAGVEEEAARDGTGVGELKLVGKSSHAGLHVSLWGGEFLLLVPVVRPAKASDLEKSQQGVARVPQPDLAPSPLPFGLMEPVTTHGCLGVWLLLRTLVYYTLQVAVGTTSCAGKQYQTKNKKEGKEGGEKEREKEGREDS